MDIETVQNEQEINQCLQKLQDNWENIKNMIEMEFFQQEDFYLQTNKVENKEKMFQMKCLLETVENIEIELLENHIVNEEIVNVLVNRFKGTIQKVNMENSNEQIQERMNQIKTLLAEKYKEIEEEQQYGLNKIEERLNRKEDQDHEEIEEENEIDENEDLEVEFEEGLDLENKQEGEWDEIDENDYTQLIDHDRFKIIEDTSVFQQKISDSYICCIDLKDEKVIMGSGNDKLYFKHNDKEVELADHTDTVQVCKFSKDGSLFASGAMEDTLCIYDTMTQKLKHKIYGASQEIRALDWHSKGKVILSGGGDGSIWLHNAQNAQFMATFQGHQQSITNCMFSNDGKKIISTDSNGELRIWDPLQYKCVYKVSGYNFHEASIESIDQHISKPIVVTAGMDYFCCLANIQTGKVLAKTQVLDEPIFQVSFNQMHEQFVAGTSQGILKGYDNNKTSNIFNIKLDGPITKIQNVGQCYLTSTAQGFIYMVDPRNQQLVKQHSCPSIIHGFVYNQDKNELYTASEDGILRQYIF